MDIHGSTHKGKLIIEEISVLPLWSIYDKGRFVFVSDENAYYLGGTRSWIRIGIDTKVRITQLDLGSKLNQLNATSIPIRNSSKYFGDFDMIEDVLVRIADGNYLQPDSILNKHINPHTIDASKLKLGINSNDVGAHNIPYNNTLEKTINTVDEILTRILSTYPITSNKNIKEDMWDYDSVEGLFSTAFFYTSLKNEFPMVQCYDKFGSLFMPSKMIVEKEFKRIRLWSPYKMEIFIVTMG